MPAQYNPNSQDTQAILKLIGMLGSKATGRAMNAGEDEAAARPTYIPEAAPVMANMVDAAPVRPEIQPPPPLAQAPVITGPAYQPAQPQEQGQMAERPRVVDPVAEGSRPRYAGEVPPPATTPTIVNGPQGQPRSVEGGGTDLEKKEAMLRALQDYKPENHNSRVKSFLIGLGRGYLRGGGLLGAIQGGVEHLVDPSSDEKFARNRDLAKTTNEVAGEYGRQKAASGLKDDEVERDYKRAQTQRALNPQYKPDVVETPDGPVSVSGTSAKPIYDPEGNRIPAKPGAVRTEIRHDPQTGKAQKWELRAGQKDRQVEDWTDPKLDLVKTKSGRWVPQSTAEMADATRSERDYRHERDSFEDNRRESERMESRMNRNEDKGETRQGKEDSRKASAAKLSGEVEEHNADAAQWDHLAAITKDEAVANYYKSLALGARKKGVAAAKQLSEGYGDIYEAGEGEGGWAYTKPKSKGGSGAKPKSDPLKLYE